MEEILDYKLQEFNKLQEFKLSFMKLLNEIRNTTKYSPETSVNIILELLLLKKIIDEKYMDYNQENFLSLINDLKNNNYTNFRFIQDKTIIEYLQNNHNYISSIINKTTFFDTVLELLKNINSKSEYLNYVVGNSVGYNLGRVINTQNDIDYKKTDIYDIFTSITFEKMNVYKAKGTIIDSSFGGYLEKQIQKKTGEKVISYSNNKREYCINYILNILNENQHNIEYRFYEKDIAFEQENCDYIINLSNIFGKSKYNIANLKQYLPPLNRALIYSFEQLKDQKNLEKNLMVIYDMPMLNKQIYNLNNLYIYRNSPVEDIHVIKGHNPTEDTKIIENILSGKKVINENVFKLKTLPDGNITISNLYNAFLLKNQTNKKLYLLSDVLKQRKEKVIFDENNMYHTIEVKQYGKGLVLKELKENKKNLYAVKPNDLIVSVYGLIAGGVTSLSNDIKENIVISNSHYAFEVDSSIILPEFLVLILQANYIKKEFESLKNIGLDGRQTIKLEYFLNLNIFVPDIKTQKEHIAYIKEKEKQLQQIQKELELSRKNAFKDIDIQTEVNIKEISKSFQKLKI